ncbi:NAD(P)-dependent dehydrogenase, short-chain alcohol dehydrogenase family [Actinacidiphila yanglinensis]|uniref:NAD(P)-dependent dehydrogenase, short-chain alcohol dehydrogenase family n=1 Tax=Actinacidiphila yanglinensis TaxID=310779 RepID=A0A1H5ZIW0_9ACTN|nr:SDR family oxidoreductase [Actinacidiphila yanglinensis]SEG35944.1 NAD(P)-dependent dehydrogenase, short-chain alcohol dehydrogenase family [Actinacidiphila yanglinensis]
MEQRFEGRTALVTGSTSGIGAEVARALAAEGALVVVSGRRAELGAAVVAKIEAEGGRAVFVPADLSAGGAAVRELADATLAAVGGRLDILVNNAALLLQPRPTGEVDEETLDAAYAISVKSAFQLTGALVPAMAERGDGVVVNMGSISGSIGMGGSALYSMTKAAVHSLTKSWAAEYGPRGVRVNAVAPGPTATEGQADNAHLIAPLLATAPDRRMGRLEEVAAAVVFLAGDGATHIHGAILPVDGGLAAV